VFHPALHAERSNPFPTLPATGLAAPEYTNPAQADAVARCRRDGGPLYRVTAIYLKTGERFGHDLPYTDAAAMLREFLYNPRSYSDMTFLRIR
jgi:hypothetical protein